MGPYWLFTYAVSQLQLNSMLQGTWGEIKAQIASEWIDLEWASTYFYTPGHCRGRGIFKAPHKVA